MNHNEKDKVTFAACQCKGVRACALCESNGRKPGQRLNVANIRRAFVFCPKCRFCFQVDPRNNNNGSKDDGALIRVGGIEVAEEAITELDERALEQSIERTPWVESQSGRRKQDFGPKVNFKKRRVNSDAFCGFPSYMDVVMKSFEGLDGMRRRSPVPFEPVELCNLKYSPDRGSCIDPHFDDWWLWGERLATLNLCGDTVLTFSRAQDFHDLTYFSDSSSTNSTAAESWAAEDNNVDYDLSTEAICAASRSHACPNFASVESECGQFKVRPGDVVHVALPRRSVVLVEKEARFEWHHSVLREHITQTRLAMTVRELSKGFRDPLRPDEFAQGLELLAKAQINEELAV